MKKILLATTLLPLWMLSAASGDMMDNRMKVAQVDGRVRWTQMALGPDGVAYVVFHEDTNGQGDPVWFLTYDGTKASNLFNVTNSMWAKGNQPNIAISRQGIVGVIWGDTEEQAIYMRLYDSVNKTWGSIEKVSGGGAEEPQIAFDSQGNIFTFFWNGYSGNAYSRTKKINGGWEDTARIHIGHGGHQGGVAVAKNDMVYVMWREKIEELDEYKLYYRTRTAATGWTGAKVANHGAASISHPHMAAGGPDHYAYIATGDVDFATEHMGQEMHVITIDGNDNPRQIAVEIGLQHYPRVAIDKDGNLHLAVQLGAGDWGDGIRYTNNVGGSWKPPQNLYSTWPKVGGIAADAFGNVAVSFSNCAGGDAGNSSIWIDSLDPIVAKYFYAPTNLNLAVSVSKMKTAPQVTYDLSWSRNEENNDQYLEGYNIYVKESGGEYTLLSSVTKTTFTASFTFDDLTKKRQFGISTVSLSGSKSAIVAF